MKYFPLSFFPVAVAEVCAAHAQQSLGVVLVADAHDVAAVDGVGVQVLKVWEKDKCFVVYLATTGNGADLDTKPDN